MEFAIKISLEEKPLATGVEELQRIENEGHGSISQIRQRIFLYTVKGIDWSLNKKEGMI